MSGNTEAETILRELLHEIRTPLAALVALEALGSTHPAQGAAIEQLDALTRRAGMRLQGTLAPPAPVAVDVSHVLDETVSVLVAARGQLPVRVTGPAHCQVIGDANSLMQIMVNLLVNALRYTPAGGQVDVEIGCADSRVVIRVCDTGPGIDEKLGETIFARGVTDGNGGTGLGLFLARQMAEDMGGTLGIDLSRTGGCLLLTLPAADVACC